ncbi:MAG: hypothetical protein GEV09_27850, partial [Pseudonocardiaceae bacterium]|nr:hypothetical protein [Pseudonocardiaceae bacterium]
VDPDGTVRTRTQELPPDQWEVVIRDHHPGYIDFDTFEANQARLAANRTNAGERPAREGAALCQGIVMCGSCGQAMSTRYQGNHGYYDCARSRADRTTTDTCRSVRADVIDAAVTERLLAALEAHFNDRYELHGRRLDLVPGSGLNWSQSPSAADIVAEAVRVDEEIGAFAATGFTTTGTGDDVFYQE